MADEQTAMDVAGQTRRQGYTELKETALALQDDNVALQNENQDLLDELARYKRAYEDLANSGKTSQNSNERFADRMLGQRIKEAFTQGGCNLWIIYDDVVEILALLNVTKADYNHFVRNFKDIVALAQGEGNEEWVRRELEELYFELQLYRSRGDNELKGTTERTELTTNRIASDSRVHTPQPNRPAPASFTDGLKFWKR